MHDDTKSLWERGRDTTLAPQFESLGGHLVSRIDLLTLQLFLVTVEEGGIARAARRQHIAASAVSKRICDLEQMLRVQLIERRRRGVSPTPAGRELVRHARTILTDLKQLEDSLLDYANDSQDLKGHLSARANESAFFGFFPNALSSFLREYPKVTIDLQPDTSTGAVQAVKDNEADIGIFWGNQPVEGLQVHPCYVDRLVVVTPCDHPLAVRSSIQFEDLLRYELIGQEAFSSIQHVVEQAAAQTGSMIKTRIRVAGFDAVCRMAGAGLGIGLVPEYFVSTHVASMRLAKVILKESWANRVHKICVRDTEDLPMTVRLFLEHMSEGE